jgi:hypothetical protein
LPQPLEQVHSNEVYAVAAQLNVWVLAVQVPLGWSLTALRHSPPSPWHVTEQLMVSALIRRMQSVGLASQTSNTSPLEPYCEPQSEQVVVDEQTPSAPPVSEARQASHEALQAVSQHTWLSAVQ